MPEFPSPRPVNVVVKLASGALEITAEERDTTVVDVESFGNGSDEAAERTKIEFHGDTLTVTAPEGGWLGRRSAAIQVTIRVPLDSSLRLKAASADTACRGRFAAIDVNSASGDISFEHVTGDARVKIASGDVTAGQVDGELQVGGAAGDVSARHVGGLVDTNLASGNVEVGEAGAGVSAKSASGSVRIGTAQRGTVKVRTTSGAVSVGVRSGTGVWLDVSTLSGHTRNDLDMGTGGGEGGHDLSLDVRTVSGDIDIRRVPAAAPA
ncbi:DUF4097 family beta strand repeat-containing protein [Phytohabitans rumicis]|uniref:DUF4097 domain-containing protein n=1 Tax=Phytohabitans rumicis TaxID=1076125 RepID=A0A6V8KV12_9ACTN|nr:DUF4097 family beta strand repeat-containing protein [Phytohabitans rumicis]GFJ88922.1 hypothetical protein Prum_025640 [Phytohabitans rumicis]